MTAQDSWSFLLILECLDLVAGATFTAVAACFPFSLFELNVGQFLCMSLQAVGLSASEPEKDSLSFSFFQRLGASMLIRSGPVRLGGQTIRQKTQTVWQLLESTNR